MFRKQNQKHLLFNQDDVHSVNSEQSVEYLGHIQNGQLPDSFETVNSLNSVTVTQTTTSRLDQYQPQQSSIRHRSDSEPSFHSEHDSDNRSITELDDEHSRTVIDSMVNMDAVISDNVHRKQLKESDDSDDDHHPIQRQVRELNLNNVDVQNVHNYHGGHSGDNLHNLLSPMSDSVHHNAMNVHQIWQPNSASIRSHSKQKKRPNPRRQQVQMRFFEMLYFMRMCV